jgi:hypothetical protein
MARILFANRNTFVAAQMLDVTANIVTLQAKLSRLRAVMDQITSNGANKALLETPNGETQAPSGTGATLYDGFASIKTSIDGLAATVSVIDQ